MIKREMERLKRKAKAMESIAQESDKKAALMPPSMKDDAAVLHATADCIRAQASHLFPAHDGADTNTLPEEAIVKTYTIRLCKNSKEFMAIRDVADLVRPKEGETIDGKWRARGVIGHTVSEIVVDVEAV